MTITEADIAAVAVAHWKEQGWTIDEELAVTYTGGYGRLTPDIVRTKGDTIEVAEVKRTLTAQAIAQVQRHRGYVHGLNLVVGGPLPPSGTAPMLVRLCQRERIGLFVVTGDAISRRIRAARNNAANTGDIIRAIHHRHAAGINTKRAGTPGGPGMSGRDARHRHLREILHAHGPLTATELYYELAQDNDPMSDKGPKAFRLELDKGFRDGAIKGLTRAGAPYEYDLTAEMRTAMDEASDAK